MSAVLSGVGWRTADLTGMKGKQLAFYEGMKRKFALPADLGGEPRVYASKADWDKAYIERLNARQGADNRRPVPCPYCGKPTTVWARQTRQPGGFG